MIIVLLNVLATATVPIFTSILITIFALNAIFIYLFIYLFLFLFSMLLITFRDALKFYCLTGPTRPFVLKSLITTVTIIFVVGFLMF